MALLWWCGALLASRWGTGPLLAGIGGAVAVQAARPWAVAAGRLAAAAAGLAGVALAATADLDGPYGVAPDGWVEPAAVRALAGVPSGAVPVPGRLRLALAARRVPPAVPAYASHPWVVANDRLRAAGWAPRATHEEAYVATHAGAPWSRISPRRRQDLILGAAASAVVGLPAAAAVAVRRSRRRRA
jgi:hypothetical protein